MSIPLSKKLGASTEHCKASRPMTTNYIMELQSRLDGRGSFEGGGTPLTMTLQKSSRAAYPPFVAANYPTGTDRGDIEFRAPADGRQTTTATAIWISAHSLTSGDLNTNKIETLVVVLAERSAVARATGSPAPARAELNQWPPTISARRECRLAATCRRKRTREQRSKD